MAANETVLTNATLILPDDVTAGTVVLRDGLISDVQPGSTSVSGALDLGGDYLMPGIVELHTDHLEAHYHPRPGVRWHPVSAALAHDAQIIAAGITTVLDAVCVGTPWETGKRTADDSTTMIEALADAEKRGLMRCEHHLHLRCEIVADDVTELAEKFAANPEVRLISVMDHTPGQRQFVKLEKFREYYSGKAGMSDADIDSMIRYRLDRQAKIAAPNRQHIVELARHNGIPLASHDDATIAHVDEALGEGAAISEFPTTAEAAAYAHANGLAVLMGAPNVVRGGSHSGNVSAGDLAASGQLDILSSDYVPSSLLLAMFQLAEADNGFDLASAAKLVSETPAKAAGMDDRGRLEPGMRGDLIHVHHAGDVTAVRGAWVKGERRL